MEVDGKVPVWVQNILDHPHLMQSFTEDMQRQKHLAELEGLRCIEKSDMAKAQIALGKVKTFQAMLFSVNSVIKEKEAQNGYIQQRGDKATSKSRSRK